jgi:hypothetical protein
MKAHNPRRAAKFVVTGRGMIEEQLMRVLVATELAIFPLKSLLLYPP